MKHVQAQNNLKRVDAQIVQKLKNNEPRLKFTGSLYMKKACTVVKWHKLVTEIPVSEIL